MGLPEFRASLNSLLVAPPVSSAGASEMLHFRSHPFGAFRGIKKRELKKINYIRWKQKKSCVGRGKLMKNMDKKVVVYGNKH